MKFQFSTIGKQLSGGSGIEQLMDDLGHALHAGGPKMRMLGGGNPAAIPEMTAVWREEMLRLITETPDRFDRMLVNYDPCRGSPTCLQAVANFFNRHYGWGLTTDNVVVTNGGQTAFFYLINLLAGTSPQGQQRRVLLPLVPEYIGYANQGLAPHAFRAIRPQCEQIDEVTFKYRVDFEALEVTDEIAAICVSRPTNPSGNVLTDEEIDQLRDLALSHEIPLIVDNAYGAPFPNIVFRDVRPPWGENVVLTYSLSKLGLPGTRTGIVIGPPQITRAIGAINAVAGLASGNIGQVLVTPLLDNDRLLELSRDVIRPFYQKKSTDALAWLAELMPSGSYRVHVSEGALFLWLCFPHLPITTVGLYERLKKRDVLVVPGKYFFYGLDEAWPHQDECIRLTFSMPPDDVRAGIEILADEIRRLSG